jgi:hypothetical protein
MLSKHSFNIPHSPSPSNRIVDLFWVVGYYNSREYKICEPATIVSAFQQTLHPMKIDFSEICLLPLFVGHTGSI